MFKNFFLTSSLIIIVAGVIYPIKKENTPLFGYCYSLEKILLKNTIQKRENVSGKVKSISKDIAKFGLRRTKGALINKIIDQYKTSKNNVIIKVVPNRLYCLAGYWIENIKPGMFESIFYEKSKKVINELSDVKDELDGLLKDINLEYKNIKKELKSLF